MSHSQGYGRVFDLLAAEMGVEHGEMASWGIRQAARENRWQRTGGCRCVGQIEQAGVGHGEMVAAR